MSRQYNFFVYIVANFHKNVIYVGITNDLERRIYEHETGMYKGYTKKYNCHYLVYYEHFTHVQNAIDREKQIKKWCREKKDRLIHAFNPKWRFLNKEIENI